jgi:hypothetical protein
VLPHYLADNHEGVVKIAQHCENYLTLLRYFDLKEVASFITFVNKNNFANSKMKLTRHFESINELNMKNIKIYYIKLLQNIMQGTWSAIYLHFKSLKVRRIPHNDSVDIKGNKIVRTTSSPVSIPAPGTAGVYVTTKDAYTLTDGPTIFITNEIEKIAKFCIQQANIPGIMMDEIMKKIEFNNILNEKMNDLETTLDYKKEQSENSMKNSVSEKHAGGKVQGRNKSTKDCKKLNREGPEDASSGKADISKLTNEINALRLLIKSATLNDTFIPNKHLHIKKWADGMSFESAFTSNIDEQVVNEIMLLNGIENTWKILLMMGIGVFINHDNIKYTEIMKTMADEQKLYMIIASSDYIYGTNYQFCHGYLSKDLNLTQEKIIQAMGRIGRNNIQQNYTLRFRDDAQIMKLFTNETDKPEVINMNKLFKS